MESAATKQVFFYKFNIAYNDNIEATNFALNREPIKNKSTWYTFNKQFCVFAITKLVYYLQMCKLLDKSLIYLVLLSIIITR